MLRVDQVHVIRHKVLVEGLSQRRVARDMGINRRTVSRYLGISEPVRSESEPRERPVYEKVEPRLAELIAEWRDRTTQKQRLTGSRLHRQLVEEGHEVGITLVRHYLHEVRRKEAEVFIPLVHRPGDEAQVDFFEVTVDVEGERRKAWMFLMRLMYSGRDFAWIYDRCDQLSFLDGHVRAFAHFGALSQRCVYDNLKLAVAKVLIPHRKLTDRFKALASHYLFEPCFTRIGEGHDKGGVEARGKGTRLQHLVPIPVGKSLREISEGLLAELDAQAASKRDADGKTVLERFAEERPLMRPMPATEFEARKPVPVSIRSNAKIRLEGASYSVPSHWARLEATAYVGVEDVRVVCRDEVITRRKEPFGGESIHYRDYLPELAKKPQAVRQVAPELVAELGEPFGKLWKILVDKYGPLDAARVFARVIGAITDHGEEAVREALEAALSANRADLLGLRIANRQETPKTIVIPQALASYQIEAARAADYDRLLVGGGNE
jgi:transposase